MAEYRKTSERRKAMAAEEEDAQLILCKKRKLCSEHGNMESGDVKFPENSLSSAASVAYGFSEDDDESSDRVQKGSRSPDLENVVSESKPEGFEAETSTPINGGFRFNLSTPTSELCGDSEEVSMGSSTSKKKKLSPAAVKSCRDLASPATKNMPSAEEIEEFFEAAEKCHQKRFTEKYNYDFLKDVPLEGRYQWVRLQP